MLDYSREGCSIAIQNPVAVGSHTDFPKGVVIEKVAIVPALGIPSGRATRNDEGAATLELFDVSRLREFCRRDAWNVAELAIKGRPQAASAAATNPRRVYMKPADCHQREDRGEANHEHGWLNQLLGRTSRFWGTLAAQGSSWFPMSRIFGLICSGDRAANDESREESRGATKAAARAVRRRIIWQGYRLYYVLRTTPSPVPYEYYRTVS